MCYNCGKPGHIKAQCRVSKPKKLAKETSSAFALLCQRFGQKAVNCRSKFTKDGRPLGNGAPSMGRDSATTQNSNPHRQAVWTASPTSSTLGGSKSSRMESQRSFTAELNWQSLEMLGVPIAEFQTSNPTAVFYIFGFC